MEKVKEWDGIGITRGMHITCSSGYDQQGSEFLICQTDGSWKTSLNCTFKGKIDTFNKRYHKLKSNSIKMCTFLLISYCECHFMFNIIM